MPEFVEQARLSLPEKTEINQDALMKDVASSLLTLNYLIWTLIGKRRK